MGYIENLTVFPVVIVIFFKLVKI